MSVRNIGLFLAALQAMRGFFYCFRIKKIYIYIYNKCNVDSRDVECCGLGFVERCSRRQMLKQKKSGTGVSIE